MREVMMVEPGWQEMSGRWFTGGYDEIGMDVSLTRVGASPVVSGVGPRALKTGTSQDLTIFGANLPRDLQASAIDFGPGIKVDRVVRANPDSITVRVSVDSATAVGARDLYAAGSWLKSAAIVYDKIGRIAVTPQSGLARVGGTVFPKQFQQFEAIAYMNGPDGKPDTEDDIEIGPVQATWGIEEYVATFDDDDIKWVGAIDQNGLFTPALDGPNPKRVGSRNNIGDVWVVATYQVPGKSGPALKARAMLIVSVPLYNRWEPWRVEQ
jgi:quinohemoprotein amine dehydrogenase